MAASAGAAAIAIAFAVAIASPARTDHDRVSAGSAGQPSTSVSASPSLPPDATPTPTPVASATSGPVAEVQVATDDLLENVLPVIAAVDPRDSEQALSDQLNRYASEAFIAEMEAERLEFEAEGWARTGSYAIDRVEVLEIDTSAPNPTALVRACIDTSGLVITRADGVPVTSDQTRAWNIFALSQLDGEWRIDSRSFTDDPRC